MVTDWLATLPQPSVEDATKSNWFEQLIAAPLRYFQGAFPLSGEEERLLERTWELIAPLRDVDMPLVFEHGDLSHPNIMLLNTGSPGVVDWELAEPLGLPGYDLLFFLTYVAFATQNARKSGDYLGAFRGAFFGRSSWARPFVDIYAERLRLPSHVLTPLFVLSWARYIANLLLRLDTQRAAGKVTAETAAWLRANRYYALWRYAVTNASALDWQDLPVSSVRSS